MHFPLDTHEWVSLDVDDTTYLFDLTFLLSNWNCIYGQGCLGILEEPSPQLQHGCCTHGAHFSDDDDKNRVVEYIEKLDNTTWQFFEKFPSVEQTMYQNESGAWVTQVIDGACCFLNRTDFAQGPGCALHQAALANNERPLDWKPEVCWQVPLRLDHHSDDNDHDTYILREWKRRDWGEGGADFHWWCTSEPEAFSNAIPVLEYMEDEIIEMIGQAPFDALHTYLQLRPEQDGGTHPATR